MVLNRKHRPATGTALLMAVSVVGRAVLGFVVLTVLISRTRALPPPLALEGGSEFGVNIHGGLYAGDIPRIHRAGFSWIRTDLNWMVVEKARGVYDFSSYEGLVRQLAANGMGAMFILDYGNSIYSTANDGPKYLSQVNSDQFREAYAKFSAAAAQHFSRSRVIWEQWNEPNNRHAWRTPPNASEYTALAIAAARAMRQASPDGIIVGPASSFIDLPFIETCLRGGLLQYWSGVTVHPYTRKDPETIASDYAKLRALVARYSAPSQSAPIICGEWGYSTAWKSVDEFKQANYLQRMFAFNRKQGIPLTIWYDWRDDGDDPASQEDRFGIVRRAPGGLFEPKPAYVAAHKVLVEAAENPQ